MDLSSPIEPERRVYVADHGPDAIEVYTTDDPPANVATITAYLGRNDVDEALKTAGWVRVSAWHVSDDMPAGHRVATIEKLGPEDQDSLERMIQTLAAHLPAGTTITAQPVSWRNREVAAFLAQRLREAGYELVHREVAQLHRDQEHGRERRANHKQEGEEQ